MVQKQEETGKGKKRKGMEEESSFRSFFVARVRRNPCGNETFGVHNSLFLIKQLLIQPCEECNALKASSPETQHWLFEKKYHVSFIGRPTQHLFEKIPENKRTNCIESYFLVVLQQQNQRLNWGYKGPQEPADFLLLDQVKGYIWHVKCDPNDLADFEKASLVLLEDSDESPRFISMGMTAVDE